MEDFVKKFKKRMVLLILTIYPFLNGCQPAAYHKAAVQDDTSDRITVGKVQKEVYIGMTSAAVAEVLGSPNIVTTDEERREVWIYDKISTNQVYSSSRGGVNALVFGLGGDVGGGSRGNASISAGASSSSQRTITVIVKYDKQNKVRDFAYHSSSF